MSTLESAKSSEERGPLQLQKTKDGYSVTRGGRTFAKQPEFAEAVAKVWKNVSSNAGDEKKKNRHFYRLVELALSLEEAQLSGLPVTEDEARTLESARKTTIVTALHMLSDKNEKINFTEIQKDIGSRVDAIRSKDTKAKLAEVHRLSQLASLLCDAVHTGAFSGDEEQAVQALATASLAIAEAGTVLSPLRKEVPTPADQELGRIKTKLTIVIVLRNASPRLEQLLRPIAESITLLKKEDPALQEVIDKTASSYSAEIYLLLGKEVQESISKKMKEKGSLSGVEWEEIVDAEVNAFVMKCQPAVDREKLKKIVLYECIEKSFGALEEACKKIPPAEDWYLKMVEAEHAFNALHLDQARQEAIVKKYGTTFQRMSDALFSGTTLKTTLRRPSDAITKKPPNKIPAGLEGWCASCASVAMRDTFGRLDSIMVGGEKVETPNREDSSDEGRLRKLAVTHKYQVNI